MANNIIVRKTALLDRDPYASSDNPDARPFDKSSARKFRDNYDDIFRKKAAQPPTKRGE